MAAAPRGELSGCHRDQILHWIPPSAPARRWDGGWRRLQLPSLHGCPAAWAARMPAAGRGEGPGFGSWGMIQTPTGTAWGAKVGTRVLMEGTSNWGVWGEGGAEGAEVLRGVVRDQGLPVQQELDLGPPDADA